MYSFVAFFKIIKCLIKPVILFFRENEKNVISYGHLVIETKE